MLRVLTLSTLFPNSAQPTLGVFVERQTLGLAARDDVELEVIAPIGLPVWPLLLHPHYAPLRRLPIEEEYRGLRVHRPRYRVWPVFGAASSAGSMAAALLPLLTGIRGRFPFDVIDAEYFWPDGPAAMRLSEALDIPFSVKARGSDIYLWGDRPRIGPQILEAAQRAGGLLAVSTSLKAEMTARGFPDDRIQVHHTGVDLDRFRPLDRALAKANLGVSGPLLVCAGGLIPRKGQAAATEAVRYVPGATLMLVGDGPDRSALERQVRQSGLQDRVRFLGSRPHDELPALLAAADVAVQPSSAEGLANVWVEALACGTPVVTCDVGGARDVIDRPAAGRLVPREPEAIAGAVRELLAAPPDPAEIREGAEKFSWERNADELFEHLSLVARR
jgi:teichuronic acid biosynthesis glycosyltransferase TuaC